MNLFTKFVVPSGVQDMIAMEDYLKEECQDLNFTAFKACWVVKPDLKEGRGIIIRERSLFT